jgi:hypothetical protein
MRKLIAAAALGTDASGIHPGSSLDQWRLSMVSRIAPLAMAGTLVLSTASQAAELCPLDAYVVDLGGGSAVVYYTVDQDDLFRVVTTVGTDREAASARFVSYLAPGKKAEISVAGAVGTTPAVLEITRSEDGWPATVRLISAEDSHRANVRAGDNPPGRAG